MQLRDYMRLLPEVDDVREVKLALVAIDLASSSPWPHLIAADQLAIAARRVFDAKYFNIDYQYALAKCLARSVILSISHSHLDDTYYAPYTDPCAHMIDLCKKADRYPPAQHPDQPAEVQAVLEYLRTRYDSDTIEYVLRHAGPRWTWQTVFVELALTQSSQANEWEVHTPETLLRMYSDIFHSSPEAAVVKQMRDLWERCPDMRVWQRAFLDARSWNDVADYVRTSINEEQADPVFMHAIQQYRSRVNPYVDPAVRATLQRLSRQYRDISAWDYAFDQAAHANALNLNYVAAVLRGKRYQQKLQRRKATRP